MAFFEYQVFPVVEDRKGDIAKLSQFNLYIVKLASELVNFGSPMVCIGNSDQGFYPGINTFY